jgi:ABC-type glycerol-3-phosphate transport system substrate-binding protein
LYWNQDTLSTAGYAQAPLYWDDLYDMATKITKRSEAGSITKSLIGFGEYSNVQNAKDIITMLILQAGGNITLRDTASGTVIAAISPRTGDKTQATPSALRFYTEFADPSKDDYTWNRSLANSRQAFAAGDVALYVGYASEEPLISRMNPNLNFSVAGIPQIRNSARSTNMARVYAFATPRASANPTGALIVASVLSAADISKLLSTALGIPSARRDVLSIKVSGDGDLFNKQAIIARSWIDPEPIKTGAIFRDMIENTTSGTMLLTESVQRAEQEMEQLLSQ